MKPAAKRIEDKTERILVAAQDIIRETGDFDLPMRMLAARAQVSLRTPYELFGSKNGVIRSLLKRDQAVFVKKVNEIRSVDQLENLFDRVRYGIGFYSDKQPFYRALFRATQGYSGGDETEPARENVRSFSILSARAQAAGLIRPEIDPQVFGETLTDIFASNVRTWASSTFDIALVTHKICYGFAVALAAVATEPAASRMRDHILDFQDAIHAFDADARLNAARTPVAAVGAS
jgi:AcrR family transcriptional regulator